MYQILGKELRPGDIIAPWGGRTTKIRSLRPYEGPLKELRGAQIAYFEPGYDFTAKGMTIMPDRYYDVLSRG